MKRRIPALLLACVLCACALFALPVAAEGEADLTIVSLDWAGGDGQVLPGTELRFETVVKNVGTAPFTGDITVDLKFGSAAIATLTHTVKDPLSAGSAVRLTSEVWKAPAGDSMVSARITTPDANEKNNARQTNLRVAENRVTPAFNADTVTAAGMIDLTFNDDFSDLSTFDNDKTGADGYKWYIRRRWGQEDMKPTDYSVADGVLTIAYDDATYTIGASTIDCKTHAGYTFNKGYIEARVRIPKATDAVSKTAIWSFPIEKWAEGLDCGRYVEADWMEYFGENRYFGITLHDMEKLEDGTTNWYRNSESSKVLNDEDWHVMGWLWEDNKLSCYVDGEELYVQTYGPNEVPIPIHDNAQGEYRMEGIFEVMDQQNMMLYIAGSKKMPMEFDYLRIWQAAATEPVIKDYGPFPWLEIAAPLALIILAAAALTLFLVKRRREA